ncbi:ataxin-3 isoform X2 [Carcharodon carcharias]|uniref:ataxin-3 isoform X2 n=1 Tax=Carcharodon carcharias TaxID=13397 RepID=UPI001B7DF045|nr:ataxin-3 isoform X2 [Carcharodon carcharias]
MEAIFHEKQEGSLCAQHCLNNLLQGEYFSPIDLSTIAQQLDEEERERMAEGGTTTEEYRIFLQQPSGNMDDSGFFSIQWFNLNSLLTGPELISDTYLALFLAQLQQEGYSIFVVRGELPECEADELLKRMKVVQRERPKLIGEEANQRTEFGQRVQNNDWEQAIDMSKSITNVLDEDDENLQRALTLSRQHMETEDEEADLRRAIHLSMQGFGQGTENSEVTSSQNVAQSSRTNQTETPTAEELRRRRQAYFERKQQVQPEISDQPGKQSSATRKTNSASMTEQELPQADVSKSLEADANDNSKGKGS